MSDDIKLTAYALNQSPPDERERLEAQLANEPDSGRNVQELARLATLLRSSLAESPLPEPSSDLRRLVEDRLAAAVQPSILPLPQGEGQGEGHGVTPPRRLWLPISIAASLFILGTLIVLSKNLPREVASFNDSRVDMLASMPGEAARSEEMLNQVLEQDISPTKDLSLVNSSPTTTLGAMGSVSALAEPQAAPGAPMPSPSGVTSPVGEVDVFSVPGIKLSGSPRKTPTPETRSRSIASTVTKPTHQKPAPYQPQSNALGIVDSKDHYFFEGFEGRGAKAVEELLTNLRRDESMLGRAFGNDHPRVKAVRLQIREVEDLIAAETPHSTEAYDAIVENDFLKVSDNPLSTFSIDVDTASYTNVRRFLTQENRLPPPGAVRIEEFVNYFAYDYPQPKDDTPFSVTTEVADCPWNAEHRLVRIGLKGREIAPDKRPVSNLVFLIDVSGSMSDANKLPLVQQAMKLLTEQLNENDRVAIVVYAGASGLVLPSTRGDQRETILAALEKLQAGGSTNGAQGLELAYETAAQNFIKGGTNRVILATDGDFNVGVTSQDELVRLIEEKAKSGVFFTALGFGMGNLKDSTLEKLADKGNGNYAYIDTEREAARVFGEQMCGTLITIAKDVKLQLEFNPARVGAFRLLGYENHVLAHEDFNNDKKDAGEIGAGHTVTALYELIPPGKEAALPAVDALKYQQPATRTAAADAAELLTVKLRYKQPDGDTSKLMEQAVTDVSRRWAEASVDFKFAASVASLGMLLRNSAHKGNATSAAVLELATEGLGPDKHGHRAEFIELVKKAKSLGK